MTFDVAERTILLTVAGSRAYGMALPTSDLDVKGVLVAPAEYMLGIESFEQVDSPAVIHASFQRVFDFWGYEHLPVEGSVYELRKFVKLAHDANPNILDVLFCADGHLLRATPAGHELRQHRHLFLSARAKHTFSGYAIAQMKRIRSRHLRMQAGEDVTRDRDGARGDLEKQFGYDTKHAAHLVRLLRMGHEILTTGVCNVYRGGIDAGELLAIRNGAWTYEEVEAYAADMDAQLTDIYDRKAYVVPHTPDRKAINELCVELARGWC